jgi:hypothetical protein
VIAALDAAMFKECFLAWVETLRAHEPDMIAIDGKKPRRPQQGPLPLHTVSAWATRNPTKSPPFRCCCSVWN